MRSTVCFLTIALLLLALTPATSASAAGVVGTGTPASCTEPALRAAVALGGDITFSCGPAMHTITLSDDLLVSKDTSIDGGGPGQGGLITLSGGGTTRVILTSNFARLTVRNLTIIDGKEPGVDGRGGAIRGGWRCPVTIINSVLRNNDGTAGDQEGGAGAVFVHETQLLVQSSLFADNRGVNGGAINNLLSVLTVEDSVFRNNDTTPGATSAQGHGYGGAIYTDGATWPTNDAIGGQITIRRSQFIGNRGAGQGGAVFSFVYPPDTVLIEDTLFQDNQLGYNAKCYGDGSCDALGGALRHGNGGLTLRNTTFVGNTARSQGGAFWTDGNFPASLSNLTFFNNRAEANTATGKGGLGGAIAGSGNWACNGCTFAANYAGFIGGAIFGGDPANTSLKNSAFVGNSAYNDGNGWNKGLTCASQYGDGGGNVQHPAKNPNDASDTNCAAGVLIANPLLGSIGSYGGFTPTMPLLDGSPAAGHGAGCLATDQRGVVRPASGCDSGAYQIGAAPVLVAVGPALLALGQQTTLSLSGADFAPSCQVLWGADPLPTTYLNRTSLRAVVTPAAVGAALVSVRCGGSASPPLSLQVAAVVYRVALPIVLR
jgi:hypothetical protein